MVALVVLCLATGLLFALLLRTTTESRAAEQLFKGEIQAKQRQVEESAAAVAQLQAQLRDLVNQRLPRPLRELLTDEPIELDQAPLRTVLFTQVGTAERPGYEYRLHCKNEGPERFEPRLRILLFNEAGIQTASANLSDSADVSRLGTAGMAVGESSTFSGRIIMEFDDPPKYFMIISLEADGRLLRLSR
jgi:hypothetical protein